MSKVNETKKNYKLIISIIVATLFVLATFIGVWFWQIDKDDRGIFGDLFGSVNALYSGLAFIGVIYAILLQKEELKLQREELRDTRIELKRTADAQEKSELQLNKLNRFNQIIAQLNASNTLIDSYQSQLNKIYYDSETKSFASFKLKPLEKKVAELTESVEVLLDECNKLKNS